MRSKNLGSPDLQVIGVLVIFVVLMTYFAFLKYSDDKMKEKKWRLDSELERARSWDEHTRNPVETERATIENMAKRWAVLTTYGGIISAFEESSRDESRAEPERAFYAEVVRRLKDMQKGASPP